MPRAATWLAVLGVGLVTLAVAISIPGSAASSVPMWELSAEPTHPVVDEGAASSVGATTPTPAMTTRASSSPTPAAAVGHHRHSAEHPASTAAGTDVVTPVGGESPWGGPEIAPSPAVRLRVPSIGVDAAIVPVDSTPTGARNPWGGEIFNAIDFPVDGQVRQWVRRGDPNSVVGDASDVTAFDRVVLYGHASDIGSHLVFQDLSALQPGDELEVDTALGTFTYRADRVLTQAKANLDALPELYDYPSAGAKEIALVACLPDTSNNVVVLGSLVGATSTAVSLSTDGASHSPAR